MMGTWLQLPVISFWFTTLGWLALAVWGYLKVKRRRPALSLKPESLVPALLLGGVFARLCLFPVTMWDGRSIWLLRAKQIFFHGMLPRAEAQWSGLQWSHTSYPLLLPGFLAHFTSLSGAYNERMASLGLFVFLTGLMGVIWFLARKQLGRAAGAALTLCLFLGAAPLFSGGYADGFLMLLLTVQFLALAQKPFELWGWLAALSASITKNEGLVLAGMIAVYFTCFGLCAPRNWRCRLLPFLVFLPALIHAAWGRALGLAGDFDGLSLGTSLGESAERIGTLAQISMKLFDHYPLLPQGLVAALAVTAGFILAWKRFSRLPRAAALLGFGFLLFSFTALFFTPQDIALHASTALDRLMLQSGAFFLLSLFLSPE